MRKLITFSLLLVLSLSLFRCGADGELDEALVRDYAERFQEEVLPTKEEFRRLAEKQIANLPADEQAEARKELEETLAKWPTDAEIDEAIDKAIDEMPTQEELDKALSEISEEGGILGRMISGAVRGAIKDAPTPEEVNKMVDEALEEARKEN